MLETNVCNTGFRYPVYCTKSYAANSGAFMQTKLQFSFFYWAHQLWILRQILELLLSAPILIAVIMKACSSCKPNSNQLSVLHFASVEFSYI